MLSKEQRKRRESKLDTLKQISACLPTCRGPEPDVADRSPPAGYSPARSRRDAEERSHSRGRRRGVTLGGEETGSRSLLRLRYWAVCLYAYGIPGEDPIGSMGLGRLPLLPRPRAEMGMEGAVRFQ